MSGVISTVTFALVVAVGAMLTGNAVAAVVGALAALATVVPVVAGLLALRHGRLRARLETVVARGLRRAQRVIHRPEGDPRALIDATMARLVGLRLRGRGWAFVFFMATLNWAADLACLALAIMAVGSPVPWSGLILAWSVREGAGQFRHHPRGSGRGRRVPLPCRVPEGTEVSQDSSDRPRGWLVTGRRWRSGCHPGDLWSKSDVKVPAPSAPAPAIRLGVSVMVFGRKVKACGGFFLEIDLDQNGCVAADNPGIMAGFDANDGRRFEVEAAAVPYSPRMWPRARNPTWACMHRSVRSTGFRWVDQR